MAKKKKSKERMVWEKASDIMETYGGEIDDISILNSDNGYNEFRMKVYCGTGGYCFELICNTEPDEVEYYGHIEDGCVYSFTEPWEGFNKAGIDKAIEILNVYS